MFFFILQLLLCLYVRKKRWVRWIPVLILLTEWVDVVAAEVYEINHTGVGVISLGGPYLVSVPASVIASLFCASCAGVFCALIVYDTIRICKRIYRKKQITERNGKYIGCRRIRYDFS